jgi:hypothetical protein
VETKGFGADHPDFGRYQVIVDRAPFGANAGAPEAEAQPNFAARYGFIGLVKTQGAGPLLAMVQDKERNKNYFLAEGETIPNESVKVLHIERSPSKLVLQQGLETATLAYLPTGSAPPMTTAPPQPPGPAAPPVGRRRIPFMRGGG